MDKVQHIHDQLKALRDEVKMHANEATDTDCKAMCETTYEVLNGLETTFDHYLQKSEPAFQ